MADERETEKKAAKIKKEKKSDKVSHLRLEDINAKIEIAKGKMGGLQSKYAQFLLARREVLMLSGASGGKDLKRAA